MVPHPANGMLYLKLRDDPETVQTLTLPVTRRLPQQPAGNRWPTPAPAPAQTRPRPATGATDRADAGACAELTDRRHTFDDP